MNLYETDEDILISLIKNKSDSQLILYNFATDLMYSDHVQVDLMNELLPLYLSGIDKAILKGSAEHVQIINRFNDALFFNRESIVNAISVSRFSEIMEAFEKNLSENINLSGINEFTWIPWYNTFLALDDNNIISFFTKFNSKLTQEGQSSFFLYITCFLFNKEDNLILEKIKNLYQTPILWDFQSDKFEGFYWNLKIRESFLSFVTLDFIKELFLRVRSFLLMSFKEEDILFLENEINSKEIGRVLEIRRNEYQSKMEKGNENQYWLDAF